MDSCGLVDAGCVGNRFPWHNKQKDKPFFQRLDMAWVNMQWLDIFLATTVHTLSKDTSDHNPIKLLTKPVVVPIINLQNVFKMVPMWYSQPGFSKMVDLNWKIGNIDFVDKLSHIIKVMTV